MKSFAAFLFTAVLLASSCSKFEDGPAFSLRSKKQRLANTWRVSQVFETHNDVTADSTVPFHGTYNNTLLTIDRDGNYLTSCIYYFYTGSNLSSTNQSASGEAVYTRETAHLYFSGGMFGLPAHNTILRLKERELWLTGTMDDGTEIEVHWVPFNR